MLPLADSAKQALLDVARRAVILAVERRELLEDLPDDEALRQPAGAFVTLHRLGRLRGCVGQLASKDALVSVVAYCAMAAALDDPRFASMTPPELEGLAIEISVLSPLVEISSEQIEPGKHGLMVTRGVKARRFAASGGRAIRLDGRTFSGGNVPEGRARTRRLETARDASAGIHRGNIQRGGFPRRPAARRT